MDYLVDEGVGSAGGCSGEEICLELGGLMNTEEELKKPFLNPQVLAISLIFLPLVYLLSFPFVVWVIGVDSIHSWFINPIHVLKRKLPLFEWIYMGYLDLFPSEIWK